MLSFLPDKTIPSALCLTLCLFTGIAATTVAPSIAEAKAPSAINKRDYQRSFDGLKRDLNQQITRKNTIYESTVKRRRRELKTVLDRMKRNGVDTAPYNKEIDDFVKDAYSRLAVSQAKKMRNKINKNVPKVVAEPGIEKISPGAPTWCATIDAEPKRPGGGREIRIPESGTQITMLSVWNALLFSCEVKDYKLTQKWTAAYRQQVSNLLGLSAQQNLELLTFAGKAYRKFSSDKAKRLLREQPTLKACDVYGAPSTKLVEDLMTRHLERSLLKCKARVITIPSSNRLPFDGKPAYWLVDLAGYPSTQLARLELADRFMHQDIFDRGLANPIKSRDPFKLVNNYAMAGALPITREGVLKELTDKIKDKEALWSARVKALTILRNLARARAYVLRLSQKDPGFKHVFIDAPSKGYASYAKVSKRGKDALGLVLALEDKLLRNEPIKGCAEASYKLLTPWVKAQHKAKKFKHYNDVTFNDYEGSLLLQAVSMCGANDTANVPALAKLFEELYYNSTESQRGPLSAAYKAMFDAYNEYRLNPPKGKTSSFSRGARGGANDGFVQLKLKGLYATPIRRPRLPPYSANFRYSKMNMAQVMNRTKGMQPRTYHAKQAVIQSIKKSNGGRVKITFKRESYKSAIRKCKRTGRIDRIDSNGRFVPEYSCRTVGYESVKVDPKPIEVPAWVTKKLKRGQLLVYFATEAIPHKKQPAYGWPVASYKTRKAKKLKTLYGIAL